MPVIRISKRSIENITIETKPIIAYDADLSGFGIRVSRNKRSWFVEYRPVGSKNKRRFFFGSAAVLTAEEARLEAKSLLARVQLGGDPAAERHKKRTTPSFQTVATDYLDEADKIAKANPQEARLRPSTIKNYRSLLKRHLGPAIGTTAINRITQPDLSRLHQKLGVEKPATANRCLEFVGSVLRYAARYGFIEQGWNPTRGIPPFKEKKCERFLSEAELGQLGDSLREAETVGVPWEIDPAKKTKHVPKKDRKTKIDKLAAAAIRLLVLTGARKGEILGARWHDLDVSRAVLMVDGKTGRRPVLLSAPALEILTSLKRTSNFIFPSQGEDDAPRFDLNRPWRAVRRHAGLEGVRLHDLRHSYASVGAAAGLSLPMIGKLLGHTQPITTARYSHLADDPLRRAANSTAATIAAKLNGGVLSAKTKVKLAS
ncbi:MAG: tyrosine-type recombinase/integrase [Xanthobacteraceae bacterium]|nr:tyrosine-type recombinase/integrase [Xanthobacteraceae bacterium]